MKAFIQEFKVRWKAKTPIFFRKVRNGAITIGISCVAALAVSAVPHATPHPMLISVLTHTLIACAFIAGTSEMAKQSPEEAAKEAREKIIKYKKDDVCGI